MNYSELVEKAKLKDEKAIEKLFEMTSQKGYFVALKYLKNKEDASDILQDSYVTALSKLDHLKEPAKFDKWLYQIIANKAKNYLVKNKPVLFEQLESDDEAINFEETISDDRIEFQPKEHADYQELKSALKKLIDELPEDQRMCLLMYYFQELSIHEIAESLEVNTNTIKSRLNYARKKIKDKIDELQKNGTHLYSVSPIPFLLWLLLEEEKATVVPKATGVILHTQLAQATGKAVANKGIVVFGKTITTKVILSTVIGVTTLFGGGLAYYNYSQEKDRQDIYDSLSISFAEDLVLEYGDNFVESKLILNHTGELKSKQAIDMKKVGKQTLQYVVFHKDIERTFKVTVEIKDTKKPILKLKKDYAEFTVGDKIDPMSYIDKAYDEVDGDLKDKVKINNPTNVNKAGQYEIKYSLTDSNGLKSSASIKIIIKEKNNIIPEKQKEQGTVKKQPENKFYTIGLDHLGLNMSIPKTFQRNGIGSIPMSDGLNVESFKYVSSMGSEGTIVDVYYFPYGKSFESLEGNQGLRLRTIDKYIGTPPIRGYEAYDRGTYILAIKQGIDYPLSGTAWIGSNDNESISIRIEGKGDNLGVYAINIRVNNFDRGFSLGIDGYKEKRIQIAREIFNSIH